MLGNQIFNHANALKPRASPQRFRHFMRLDASHIGQRGVGFGRVVDFEFDQQRAQVPLVARKGSVQQQRTLSLVELQQVRQRVDVFLHQR